MREMLCAQSILHVSQRDMQDLSVYYLMSQISDVAETTWISYSEYCRTFMRRVTLDILHTYKPAVLSRVLALSSRATLALRLSNQPVLMTLLAKIIMSLHPTDGNRCTRCPIIWLKDVDDGPHSHFTDCLFEVEAFTRRAGTSVTLCLKCNSYTCLV